MIKVNYGSLPDVYFINYLNFLVGKIFKCLPMKEANEITLGIYMESLLRELVGNKDLITYLRGNPHFLSLLGKIQYLIKYDMDIKTYRKEIFDCISLVEKLKEGVKEHGELESL